MEGVKNKYWKKAFSYFTLLGLLLILTACSNYQWGSPGLKSLPFQTIYVKPVINKTFIPEAQALLSQQLIRYLQESGICITQCEEAADTVLVVVLRDYKETTLTTRRSDTTLGSSFMICVKAECTLMDNRSQKPFFVKQCVSESINAEANDNVQQVIYQDMPVLTARLANQIRNLVIETW